MPITIREEDQTKQPTCPECGARMERRSVVGDERESSTNSEGLICPECGHREVS
ncbi:zinc ribbon domain-containing protein [Humibacillus xanthopallidus]|uniref:zinc ribbon domain-containing protein n=1 Tax=Humibacillus xanthopallidus TaxID=412689 RepID=UPI00163A8C91|nr:zinc ribbon domain-containing protein [Humibacillus xanthopallidus]